MLDYYYILPALLTSPILLYQSKKTRKTVIKLPEPQGERSGVVGQGGEIKLLIFGDSAGAGVGVAHQREALSGQVVSILEKSHHLTWKLIASSGHSTKDALENLKLYKKSFDEQFDTVLISLGVNDVTGFVSPGVWIRQCNELIDLLQEKFLAKNIIWSDFPKMEKFPSLPQPLRWFVGSRKNHLRKHLLKYISQKKDVELLEFPDLLGKHGVDIKEWVALDGFHPGPRVYKIWAEEFVKKLSVNEL